MNKVVGGVVALVVVAGAASVGMGAWSGPKVAAELQTQSAKAMLSLPGVQVLNQRVLTGLMTSTHEVTVQMGCDKAALAAGLKAADAPFNLTWRDVIHHGPFPGGTAFGLASIDSHLVLPPAAAAQVAEVLGRQPLIRVHTVLDFAGGYVSEVTSPAFKYADPALGTVEWQGLKLVVRGSIKDGVAAGGSYALEAPGGSLDLALRSGPALSFKAGRFSAAGEVLPNSEATSIWMSPVRGTATWDSLAMNVSRPADTPLALAFNDMKFSAEKTFDKGLFSLVSKLSAKGMIDQLPLDGLEMQVSLRRVHAAAYEQVLSRFFDATLGCERREGAALQGAVIDELQRNLITFLRHDPEYSLDKFAVVLGGHRAEISYRVGLRGMSEADGRRPMAQILASKVYADAAFNVQDGWIEQVARQMATEHTPSAGHDGAAAQAAAMADALIDSWATQGFVVREGGAVKAAAKFEAGQLQVNGQPVPLPASLVGLEQP